MKNFFYLREKTLTQAEKKKREEVAKAIERENPNMPMAKKMAIATATAKKVAEAAEDISGYNNRRLSIIANNPNHPDAAAAKGELARRRIRKEEVDLDEATDPQTVKLRQLAQLGLVDKEQVNKLVQAFTQLRSGKSLTTQQKDMITGTFSDLVGIIAGDSQMFQKAKKAVAEDIEQVDELNKSTLASYTQKAAGSLAGNAAAAGYAGGQGKKAHPDIQRFMKNRMKGIQHAAKKLAKEETELDEVSSSTLLRYSVKAATQGGGDKGDKRIAGQKMADEKLRKKHGNSSTAKVAAGPARRESVELDEVSQAMKDRYIQKSMSSHGHNAAVASDAKSRGDQATYDKARKIMKKRNQGMTRAFGGERA